MLSDQLLDTSNKQTGNLSLFVIQASKQDALQDFLNSWHMDSLFGLRRKRNLTLE